MNEQNTPHQPALTGHHLDFGRRPALLVIDLQIGFTDPEKSIMAAEMSEQIEANNHLIAAAREGGHPVVFTVIAYDHPDALDGGMWPVKAPPLRALQKGSKLVELDPRVDRRAEDVVLVKKQASAFFGTPLFSMLAALGVDTVVVSGCTTSGCVRATTVDAISHGFRPFVAAETVCDRWASAHAAALFDLAAKYGEIVPLDELLEKIRACEPRSAAE
jgi:nicotinamidase-related amidase